MSIQIQVKVTGNRVMTMDFIYLLTFLTSVCYMATVNSLYGLKQGVVWSLFLIQT